MTRAPEIEPLRWTALFLLEVMGAIYLIAWVAG